MMGESTSTKAAILREIEDLLELHSWFPKTHHYPHLWEWYKGMKWGDQYAPPTQENKEALQAMKEINRIDRERLT